MRDRVDVIGQGEGHDICVETVGHGARLGARTPMGLFDRDVVAMLGLPVGGEGGVYRFVQLASGIVAGVQERDVGGRCRSAHKKGKSQ